VFGKHYLSIVKLDTLLLTPLKDCRLLQRLPLRPGRPREHSCTQEKRFSYKTGLTYLTILLPKNHLIFFTFPKPQIHFQSKKLPGPIKHIQEDIQSNYNQQQKNTLLEAEVRG
jgi:hypothetical protein